MIRRYLELREIRLRERKLAKEYRELLRQLHAKKTDQNEFDATVGELRMMIQECQEDRRYLYHCALEQKATRLSISLPIRTVKEPAFESDQYWVGLSLTERWVLSMNGVRQVRSEIREEQKARRDYVLGWISPFVGIVSAIVGAIVGYLLGRGAH